MTANHVSHWILTCHGFETEVPGDQAAINLSDDTVFEFLSLEYSGGSSLPSSSPVRRMDRDDEEEEEENEGTEGQNSADDGSFWEGQHQLLQATLCRTSSLESRIRSITKAAFKELRHAGNGCACGQRFDDGCCRKCLMEEVCRRLHSAGFNSAICKSKWKSSHHIPAGEHTFLDVIDTSNPVKEVRVIVEFNFRAEFEMAQAGEEYKKLISSLPEIFVGKIERLLSLLKILCAVAKKCMKARKMHLAPWRKRGYMQAKWLRTWERTASSLPLSTLGYSSQGLLARPRMSMLTADMMSGLSLHRPVVQVV